MRNKVYPRSSVIHCAKLAARMCWAEYANAEDPAVRLHLREQAYYHEDRARRLSLMLDVSPEVTVLL